MVPFEALTAEDLRLIDQYRLNFACTADGGSDYNRDNLSPIDTILEPWNKSKERLFGLFSENLLIKKEISVIKSIEEIQYLIREEKALESTFSNFIYNFRDIVRNDAFVENNVRSEFKNNWYHSDHEYIGNINLYYLVDDDVLATGFWPYENGSLYLKNGKELKVRKGSRIMRSIKAIAESYGVNGFEEFRLIHSQILNQKKLVGNLVLSIHPLDYMTMSDNSLNWDTCMSWQGAGEYKLGTVEMMNSPYVIVAYLESENAYDIPQIDFSWNNKKWRTLIVCSEDFIFNVKGYPYQNDNLALTATQMIRDLANQKTSFCTKPVAVENIGRVELHLSETNDERTISLGFSTANMYNDMDAAVLRYYWYNLNINDSVRHTIKYSGDAECMICGKVEPEIHFGDTGDLICQECSDNLKVCQCCGAFLYEDDDYYDIDRFGNYYCEECANESLVKCSYCEDLINLDSSTVKSVSLVLTPNADEPNYMVYHDFSYFCSLDEIIRWNEINPNQKICYGMVGDRETYYSIYDMDKHRYTNLFTNMDYHYGYCCIEDIFHWCGSDNFTKIQENDIQPSKSKL